MTVRSLAVIVNEIEFLNLFFGVRLLLAVFSLI